MQTLPLVLKKSSKPESDTEKQVRELLEVNSISFSASYLYFDDSKQWKSDKWLIKVSCNGKVETFDYSTGIGLRQLPNKKSLHLIYALDDLKKAKTTTTRNNALRDIESHKLPVVPSAAGVLFCLLLDSQSANESFSNWCANYGYDADSITAFNIYQSCEAISKKLGKVLSHSLQSTLNELLQDY
jgi:hypothetical protein